MEKGRGKGKNGRGLGGLPIVFFSCALLLPKGGKKERGGGGGGKARGTDVGLIPAAPIVFHSLSTSHFNLHDPWRKKGGEEKRRERERETSCCCAAES